MKLKDILSEQYNKNSILHNTDSFDQKYFDEEFFREIQDKFDDLESLIKHAKNYCKNCNRMDKYKQLQEFQITLINAFNKNLVD